METTMIHNMGKNLTAMSLSGGLLVTGVERQNIMTMGWACAGIMWYREVLVMPVRKSRFTHELLEQDGECTLLIPEQDISKKIAVCGSRSGRDFDKIAACGFEVKPSKTVRVPYIDEKGTVYELRVIFKTEMDIALLPKEIADDYYAGHNASDPHTLYFAQILNKTIIK